MAEFDYHFAHIAVTRPLDGVVLFTLDRPERRNATNAAFQADRAALPRRFDADEDARVAIVTGAGTAFCVGGDYDEVAGGDYALKVRQMRETIDIVGGLVETRICALSPLAVELTKRSLNGWLRQAMPMFETSLGYKLVTAFDPGLAATVGRGRS